MKPKVYNLIMHCVETGIDHGWRRAHKHNDNPDEHTIKDQIENAIQLELCEWFDFDYPQDQVRD